MEKEKLKSLIDENLSIRKISELTDKSYSTIRYWLNKHDLKTNYIKEIQANKNKNVKLCPVCNIEKNKNDFYTIKRRGKKETAGYCKPCSNAYHTERIKSIKIRMIEYKGGKCEKCHLTLKESNYFVFDFHHTDPQDKDPNFKRIKFKKWEFIKKELDKCQLLCSNCHRTVHYNLHKSY